MGERCEGVMIGGVRISGAILFFGCGGVSIAWFMLAINYRDYGFPIVLGLFWGGMALFAGIMTAREAWNWWHE